MTALYILAGFGSVGALAAIIGWMEYRAGGPFWRTVGEVCVITAWIIVMLGLALVCLYGLTGQFDR